MAPEPDSQGIGTPPPERPGFAAPGAAPASGPAGATPPSPRTPPQGWAPPPGTYGPGQATAPPQGWAPPAQGLVPATEGHLTEAPPPTGRRPKHPRRRSRRAVVAAIVGGGLLLVAALSALPMIAPTTPSSTGTGPAVVTARPSSAGTASTTLQEGGVGTFATEGAAGTVTVNSATWTDAGTMAAPAGERYLVLDVTVACSGGELSLNPLDLLVVSGAEKALPVFGPALERPLGGSVLTAGTSVSGQVGYALAPGAVTVHLLDEDLRTLTSIELPAP